LSPERGYLGNRRRDGRLGIFDLRTGAMRQDLNIAGNVVDVSRNGTFLLVSARNSRFAVVNSRTGERHAFIQERSDNGFSIAARYLEDRCRIQTVVPGFGMTIWNALTGEPLASISTSDKATGETNGADGSPALIAILPSGHYAATPGGEARLRVTEGLTSHPIDAYRARFNRPDLVMAVLRGTSCDGRPASAQPARR
ncbi:MAG: hypothetical protein KIT18_11875, partial [Burkholderiales bacterium]|nr:hypothetical protein [Burkholderiales bacterium]